MMTTQPKKKPFAEDFRKIFNEVLSSHEIICGGDFNARVRNQVHSRMVSLYGEVTKNNNGERLIKLCQQHDLKVYSLMRIYMSTTGT